MTVTYASKWEIVIPPVVQTGVLSLQFYFTVDRDFAGECCSRTTIKEKNIKLLKQMEQRIVLLDSAAVTVYLLKHEL